VVLLAPLVLLFASQAAAAEPLKDKLDREYVQPVFRELQGALDGREPSWTPPVLPGSAQTAALSETVRKLWLEPLFAADQAYAFSAARSLASPKEFSAPAEPDLAALLPAAAPSPAAKDVIADISRRFLTGILPDAADLAAGKAPEPAAAPRFARPEDFAPKRKTADSTGLTRGSGGTAGGPKLKAFHPDVSINDR